MAEDWQAILITALDGDSDALGTLCNGYLRPKIYGQALKRLRNRADAEDVVQNVFKKLLPSLQNIQTRELSGFEAFVVVTTTRTCIDLQRRTTPDISLSEEGADRDFASDDDVHKAIELQQLRTLLHTAMEEHLNEEERTLVFMRILMDFSFRKISEITGVPISTLHSRYQNALKKIATTPELLTYREDRRRRNPDEQ